MKKRQMVAFDSDSDEDTVHKTATGKLSLAGTRLPVAYVGNSSRPVEQYDNVVLNVLDLDLPADTMKLIKIFGSTKDAVSKRRHVIEEQLRMYAKRADLPEERDMVQKVTDNVLAKLQITYGAHVQGSIFDDADPRHDDKFDEAGSLKIIPQNETVPSAVLQLPSAKVNSWVKHVRAVAAEKGISYKEAVKIATSTGTEIDGVPYLV